jgi:sirohydrochlorin cobaltochelatase
MADRRIVLFSHGSKDERWCRPFHEYGEKLAARMDNDEVRVAFMEHAEPSLQDVAEEAHRDGITTLIVLPLFMAAGGHIAFDVPELIKKAEKTFPGLEVRQLPPIGEHPEIVDLMLKIAEALL